MLSMYGRLLNYCGHLNHRVLCSLETFKLDTHSELIIGMLMYTTALAQCNSSTTQQILEWMEKDE